MKLAYGSVPTVKWNDSEAVPPRPHAVALFTTYYNFRVHKTLRLTPAMAAGVTDRLWEMTDLVEMLEAWEARR